MDWADPAFPASLVDVAEPELPRGDWGRVEVTMGGICGSDLHLFAHNTGPSPTLVGVAAIPFLVGHEIAGRVIEAGPDFPLAVGTRVAVDPCLPCAPRAIDPPCENCAKGWTSCCLNLDSQVFTPGRSLGFTWGLGGGWAEQLVAHSSMVHTIPDGVPDAATSLHEPLSICAHALVRHPPRDGEPVLVVGAGTIGLAALAAMRGLYPASELTVLARYRHQADAARACGADAVVISAEDGSHWDALAERAGARLAGFKPDVMLMSGFPYVIEAVGSPGAITDALRSAAHHGTVLLLGAAGISRVDLTPIWYKEVALVGSVDHQTDAGGGPGVAGGAGRHSIDRALDILAAGLLPHDVVVTHTFPLDGLREAVQCALDKQKGAIKVAFRPRS